MTCKKLREYFRRDPRVDSSVVLRSADFAEHLAHCRDCNRLVEGRKELQSQLQLVRGSAPPVPDLVNRNILLNYRERVSNQSRSDRSVPIERRTFVIGLLGVAASVAFTAALAYAAMFLFSPGKRVFTGTDQQHLAQPAIASRAATAQNRATVLVTKPVSKTSKPPRQVVRRISHPASTAEPGSTLPSGFRSLMYCDELSCAGAMEVVRMQLPAPVMGLMSLSPQRNALVSADVLVGPDGIARGIRVVE